MFTYEFIYIIINIIVNLIVGITSTFNLWTFVLLFKGWILQE